MENGKVKIEEILKFEPKINVQMLMFVFLNGIAFDSLYWTVDVYNHSGEVMIEAIMVYALVFIVSLTAFKINFKKLNKKTTEVK